MVILREDLDDSSFLKEGTIDAPLLLLGLLYREVSRAVEIEPDDERMLPPHLIESPFGILQLDQIQTLINGLKFSS